MTTSSYFLLVALGLLLYVCQSSFGNPHTRDSGTTPDRDHSCGGELVDRLVKLCPSNRKRRGFPSMLKARAKRNEAFLLQRDGRVIVGDCCDNYCTDERLKGYCASLLGL
uniref:Con-Ins K2 n=1 Tax=Conus kinoshitai TaxID=376876 RepID=INS2_CONKI|nr:RecName: Full=Con-Ins K2; AltName: Full=Insulin K2; Contains: RecName: Full=Con-Ins K2 B chain; Contains: RecName: Full=Con-Ins K2 A chain; Flags: Precursor [Conus kinoshitai]AZS18884.1 insulin precursor [Conus kinoshitai]